jgi:uncharacterized protein
MIGEKNMTPLRIRAKAGFAGRDAERAKLEALGQGEGAKIVVVYGRRRVGKTELIEQTFANRQLLKFEGLERQGKTRQIAQFLETLARYANDLNVAKLKLSSWREVFLLIAKYVQRGKWTLYLEELQWLANYQSELVSALKYVWDNELRHNKKLLVILCGSAPSFMINKVLLSSALYNRTEVNFPVRQLSLPAVQQFFGKSYSAFETMDALLTVGAIPPYLERLREAPSVLIGLARESFTRDGYFSSEYPRIFTSSMADNKDYQRVLELLAKGRFTSKAELAKALGRVPGGGLADLLNDLEQTGFITSYVPVSAPPESKLKRYHLIDPYIRFYLNFIRPLASRISKGVYEKHPERAIETASWRAWLGLNFERFIRQHGTVIATILGFDGIDYDFGSYFARGTPGVQIDLVFERADKVTMLVEVKYNRDPVGREVVADFEKKCALYPRKKGRSIRRVLVAAGGASKELTKLAYFDRIITLEELSDAKNWT